MSLARRAAYSAGAIVCPRRATTPTSARSAILGMRYISSFASSRVGYHLVMENGDRPATKNDLEQLRGELRAELASKQDLVDLASKQDLVDMETRILKAF